MDEQMSAAGLLALAGIMATLTEWLAERFLPFLKKWQMVYATAVIAIGLCFLFNVDVLSLVGFQGAYYTWAGKIISGVIIGSGSNGIHKFIKPSTAK